MRFTIPTLATLATLVLSVTASPTPKDNANNIAARDPHKFHHGVFNVDKRSLEHFRRERIVLLPRQNNATTTTTTPTDPPTTTTTTPLPPPTNTTATTDKPTPTDEPDDDDDEDDKPITKTTRTQKPRPVTTQVIETVTAEDGVQSTITKDIVVTETPAPIVEDVQDGTQTGENPSLATSGSGKKSLVTLSALVVAGLVGVAVL